MANTWFRLYVETLHDPKVQRTGANLFRVWINSLCLYCQLGGAIPDIKIWAFGLRIRESRMEGYAKKLLQLKLFELHEDGYHPHNWDVRQYKSDCSTERVKRFRNVTRNVSETANETPPDTDTDTDTDIPPTPLKRGKAVDTAHRPAQMTPEDYQTFFIAQAGEWLKAADRTAWPKLVARGLLDSEVAKATNWALGRTPAERKVRVGEFLRRWLDKAEAQADRQAGSNGTGRQFEFERQPAAAPAVGIKYYRPAIEPETEDDLKL